MAEEVIDHYIDRSGVRSDTDFMVSALNEVYSIFKKVNGVKVDIKGATGLSGLSASLSQAKSTIDSLSKSVEDLNKKVSTNTKTTKENAQIQLIEAKARKENAAAALLEAKAANELAKAKNTEAKNTEQSTKAKQAESKIIDEAINDYLQLSKAYNEAALRAKNYVIRLGENHPLAVQAVKDANDLSNVLKKLDASVGQSQRNVGNYKSAFDGLGFSFTQVARELPSLAINFQTFALAISNNLPIVADEIAKAKKEIAALKAEGKDTPSLFSRLKSAILSPQVGLSLLITGFTLLSGKLFGAGDAAKKLREQEKALTEAIKDQVEALNNQIDAFNSLDNERTRTIKKNTELRNAAGKSSIALDIQLAVEENKIAKERAIQAVIQSGINEKSAQDLKNTLHQLKFLRESGLNDYQNHLNREIKARDNFFSSNKQKDKDEADREKDQAAEAKKRFEDSDKLLTDIEDSQTRIDVAKIRKIKEDSEKAKDAAKDAKELADAELELQFKLKELELKRSADFNKEISEDENRSLTERLEALTNYYSAVREISDLNAELQKALGTKTALEITVIEAQQYDERIRLDHEHYAQKKAIIEDFTKKFEEEEKRMTDATAKGIEERFKLFEKGTADREKKEKEAADKLLKNEEDLAARKRDLYEQLARDINDLTFTLFTAGIENQKNAIQEQIDLIDERKQREIEIANQSIVITQDRAAAIQVIEARANAQKEQLQRRQKELDQKKAAFDKAQSIARIVQETAIGFIRLLGDPNPLAKGLIPLLLATSALQIAAIAAQPIPKYKHGKNASDSYAGPAIVGDGGKHEAIIREGGNIEITPNTPTLTSVKSRDIILPDVSKLIDYVISGNMGGKLAISNPLPSETISLEMAIGKMEKSIVSAIKKIPQQDVTVVNIISRRVRFGDSSSQYLNDNLQG